MVGLTFQQRVESYARTFPDMPGGWPTVIMNGAAARLRGEWQFGQDFRNTSSYYGAFPGNFLVRLGALFPEYAIQPGVLPMGGRVLHAFSGSLAAGPYDRCDIHSPAPMEPEYQCDVRDLPARVSEPYAFIIADPPYSDEDAKKYKAPPLDRGASTAALAEVTCVGGFLCWLDTVWPMYRKDLWRDAGHIYVLRSTNHRVRLLTIFERVTKVPV